MTSEVLPPTVGRASKTAMRAWLRRWRTLERVQRDEWRRATVEDRWADLMALVALDPELGRGRESGEAATRATEAQIWNRWQRLRRTVGYTS